MAHSSEYRAKATAFKEDGHTFSELAKVFGISNSTYYRWKEIKKATGKYKPDKPKASRHRKISSEELKRLLEEKPDLYLHEIAAEFGCTKQSVFSAIKRNKLTRKKNFCLFGKIRGKEKGIPCGARKDRFENELLSRMPCGYTFIMDNGGHSEEIQG